MSRPLRSSLAFFLSLMPAAARAQTVAPPAATATQAPTTRVDTTGPDLLAAARPVAGGLTADTVARRAVETSYEVRARHVELEAAAAAVDQALMAYFPRLSLRASYQRLSPIDAPVLGYLAAPVTHQNSTDVTPIASGTPLVSVPLSFPVYLNSTQFAASLTLPLSDYLLRLPQTHSAADQQRHAAEWNERAAQRRVAFDGRQTYYQWVRTRLQAVVAAQALVQAREHLVDAQRLFTAGGVSRADVLRAESQVASSELLLERARDLAEIAEDRVRIALHSSDNEPLVVGEDVLGELAPTAAPGAFSALWNEAAVNRPELRALDAAADGLRSQAAVARAGYFPRVDANADVLVADPNPRFIPPNDRFDATWQVGVALSWSPNDLASATTVNRSVLARAASTEAQAGQLRDAVRSEVLQAIENLHESDVAALTTARGLAAADEGYRVRGELFRNGRATSTEVVDSVTDLTRARLEALNARVEQRLARLRLAYALGRD